ncbi:lipid-A-disaccharide synthase N-terminal domain-containing protein [Gillisia sp. Hel_I_29]|uniref:lipid-A-disaccharide synthase N-terminal domain-containing protein n=1 Tax=Gillisia sp. Hel_I_29 TaxID=1249975 RepID=UPI00054D8988|nr:lipid-A-disaccharide synthase N-terminal domain-containing protein [Gillisia sp. Hel_I_29]
MKDWLVYGIGFLAQLMFSSRLIIQWLRSEKAKEVKTPTIFWKLSLLGAIFFFIYGYLRDDIAIMIGQALIYAVYFRNLQLKGHWKDSNIFLKIAVIVSPILITLYMVFFATLDWSKLFHGENLALWIVLMGIIGQIIYTGRFIYQWYYSEKNQESTLPKTFWIISLTGSAIIFTYAIFRKDPVLLSAHFFGAIIYIRNLIIIAKGKES